MPTRPHRSYLNIPNPSRKIGTSRCTVCSRFWSIQMPTDVSRCPKCAQRLIATIDENGRTVLRCLKCDQIDPLKTVAKEWSKGPLGDRLAKVG